MPLPVHQLLAPDSAHKPAWAVFDRQWYLQNHAEARAVCTGQAEDTALNYYLETGARLGHSPSPLFDEQFYLARNFDIAELVRAGHYASGFDHFCQHGHRGVSPHWLFDDALYDSLYEDMTLENLDAHRCYGRYDHYLKSGQFERRMAQFLFDGLFYRARAAEAGIAEAEIDAAGPYVHYLYRLGSGQAELPPSIYFEPAWYLEQNPGAKIAIERHEFRGAIQHYLCSDAVEYLDPVPQFSEQYYRAANVDIAKAVDDGFYRSGYQQFVQHGAFELRRPRADIDLVYYRDMNERVRTDLNLGEVRDAFAHLRLTGLKDNLPYCPPAPAPLMTEPAAKQQFLLRARNNLALFSRQQLNFTVTGAPTLAVIMVLFNKFELTMLALVSLRNNFTGGIELILVDNASSDDTRRISEYVRGAVVLRNASNIGFLRAANMALPHVSAPALLYLNNDTELGHAAINSALSRLNGDAKLGAAGGKIIRSNGVLQEAGSIIWNDGTTTGYMRDASPLAPEANFVRDVDYASAVFLLCQTELVKKLGGFDEAFSPAYYEDVDLCVRMSQAGFRIVYDPAIIVHHLEFGSAAHSEASMALMRRGRRIFKTKHAKLLETKLPPSDHQALARLPHKKRQRILFFEDTIPLRRLGSGFVRSNDIVHAIAAAGYDIDIFPMNGAEHDIMNLFGDFPETVEILHDRDFMALPKFLAERPDYYDLIWISRTHNLRRLLPVLGNAGIMPENMKMILDTEAVVTLRDAARHEFHMPNKKFDFAKNLHQEFIHADICRQVLAINQTEMDLLSRLGLNTALLGTLRKPDPTPASFTERAGLLFVAAIHEQDSPNYDALCWYQEEILPALAMLMEHPPILNIVGYTAPGIDMSRFENQPLIKLHGAVGDLRPYYNSNRISIAPTRFAAGTPYKIYETASFGLPSVATGLLAAQLGWQNGKELLAAPSSNAKFFAAQIAKLYHTEAIWQQVRVNALQRLEVENNAEDFNKIVAQILRKTFYNTESQRFSIVS